MIELYQLDKCPLCGGANWQDCIFVRPLPYEIEKTGIEELKYSICSCGLIFADRYIKDLNSYYTNVYRQNPENNQNGISEYNLGREKERADRLIGEIAKRIKKVRRVLDVGSSAGILLFEFAKLYKCDTLGIEPSDDYRKYSLSSGIATLENVEKVKGKFDLISIIHVLEHQTDPLGFLERIIRKVPNAHFVVEVPFFDPRVNHPLLFTRLTLKAILQKAGLTIWDEVLTKKYITVFAVV